MGNDVTSLALNVLNGVGDPSEINKTLIVLIPKVKKPSNASEFRTTSLCSFLYKIISKTLANRLKIILSNIVVEFQNAFVPNCMITNNALIAFECFDFMKNKFVGRNGSVALKLDMSKAYDDIEWQFLNQVLIQMCSDSFLLSHAEWQPREAIQT